ncbi:hypothetical protein LOY64_14330 [Pseudomonas corrugata]|uniref:Uncharacterized protein n=1 Tax=Pseudomonas corrugata TaxID=47879 RepID=A0A8B6UXS0_9PSED|nr:hypothetical protein [Pseudomonas corrugata]MDU9025166.1 hypothetical protein [Pseudomonas corrugata]MDU9035220.1 hypothetical protein [Pseudomonas corrugata]MDU9040953.1 hypothetical protein [Pseudomonas corrugata]QTH16697.1 hypothetical protein C4C32_12635 [Pseudomonas corrugata]UZD98113.1 hypothetical protein LOY64_14330 [Pseudomonas corrugata]
MSIDVDQVSKEKGFEQQDANVRGIVYVGIGLVLGLLVCLGGVHLVLDSYEKSIPTPLATALEKQRALPPEPRLQPDPAREAGRILDQARAQLISLGWIDRHKGIVHIPIADAKAALARTGWPSRARGRPGEKPYPLSLQDTQGRAR